MKEILLKDHFFLKSAQDIATLCQPLHNIGLTHFTYLKNHTKNGKVYLSNLPKWIETYLNCKLYLGSSFELSPEKYKEGYELWSSLFNNAPVIIHGRDYFNTDHGLTLIKKHEDASVFYFFSGQAQKQTNLNFYLNQLDIFEHFINYFNSRAANLLKQADKHKIAIPDNKIKSLAPANNLGPQPYLDNIKELRNVFFRQTALQRYTFQSGQYKGVTLSQQEIKCIYGLLQRMTSKRIAKQLNISNRTVDFYISNIMLKLNCQNRIELVNTLIQSGFPVT